MIRFPMRAAFVRNAAPRARVLGAALVLLGATQFAAHAQPPAKSAAAPASTLDRNIQPTPGAAPVLRVPKWTRTVLSNGAELIVSEKHELPLVAVNIAFVGGAANFEPSDKVGVAGFTAQLLSEGTASKTGDQLSDAQQLLGTTIGATIGLESGSIRFTALKEKLDPALALVAEMLLTPSFPNDAIERQRARRLVNLAQSKDQPNTIASNVFLKVLYGDLHPYGRVVMKEQEVRGITRDDVIAFHKAYFRPGRAVITVTGDVTAAAAKASVEKALARWTAGGDRPSFSYPAPPPSVSRTIYLVDKPKAAQSVFALGVTGPNRQSADYYAIEVMNNILGVLFQSRLNHNIREVKGYSYGVFSNFAYGRGPGAFRAGGGIVSAKSDSALIEFMKELRGVQGGVPFTDDEIKQGKESLTMGLASRFSSVNATGGSIGSIYTQGLSETLFQDYARNINAVTSADLVRVARKYVDVDHLNIVIVGDRATIEAPLRATGIAPIVLLNVDGKPVVTP